jgi:amino acid transporter
MPKWRAFTWIILIINLLFLIWIIAGAGSAANNVKDCSSLVGQAKDACQASNTGTAAGTAIGVGIIIVLWAFVDIILGVLWLVTRRKGRACPVCGTEVKTGVTVCPKCNYDFRTGAAAAGGTPPQPPMPTS